MRKQKVKEMKKLRVLGLRTIIYKVGDIQKAKAWYSNLLKIKPYFDQPFYVGFNVGGYELGLQPEDNPTTDKLDKVVTYWGVADILKVYTEFIALGALENEKPYKADGEFMTATVKDPWGNIIGLINNREFKQN